MNKDSLTRRHFLQKTGIATGAVLGISLLDIPTAMAGPPYVRKDVGTLTVTDPILTSYATAVAAMQALDTSDPTNPLGWQYQAAIHGTTAPSTTPAEMATWNTCQHDVEFFLSWHRMYLYYFERIIRKMSGNANWALPFWNYESTSERALPTPFWTPALPSNPLFLSDRGAGWNEGSKSLLPSAVSTTQAFGDFDFGSFWDHLEGTPHDDVHIAVGGLMGDIQTAAQDPIFYLHHCNIDRLWNAWLAQGGGRSDPLNDAPWKTTPFTFFDENKKQVTLTGCDILRAQDQLGYSYEGEPAQVREYCIPRIHIPPIYAYIPWYEIWPGPIELPASLEQQTIQLKTEQLIEHLREAPLASKKMGSSIVLKLSQVEANHQPNVYYEVYLAPRGAKLTFESPFYVGNVSLFGRGVRDIHEKMAAHNRVEKSKATLPSFTFRITRALQAATKTAGSLKQLEAVFVPRGAEAKGKPEERRPTATIRIGRAEIGLERKE